MSAESVSLPLGFEALQPFVAEWSDLEEMDRVHKRHSSSMEELQAFYSAASALYPAMMEFFQQRKVESLTPGEQALFKLALGLIEVSFYFEVYHGALPDFLFDDRRMHREVQLTLPA